MVREWCKLLQPNLTLPYLGWNNKEVGVVTSNTIVGWLLLKTNYFENAGFPGFNNQIKHGLITRFNIRGYLTGCYNGDITKG